MSVEIETNQNYNDDLASTSLLPSTANSHNNTNSSTRSRLKTDSHNETHKVHFNIVEDGETRRSSPFQRAVPGRSKASATEPPPSPQGLAARLSLAIRRSLRLGPKQRSTAAQSAAPAEHRFRSGDEKNVSLIFESINFEVLICGDTTFEVQKNYVFAGS